MDKCLTVLDERNVWWRPMIEAAAARGYSCNHIRRGREVGMLDKGLGFIRPHADPAVLEQNQADYEHMAEHLTMVQDRAQVEVYEDKSAQFWRWGKWMPPTWRFDNRQEALDFVAKYNGRLVSKADVGASSYNVRVLDGPQQAVQHVRELFGRGVQVNHCAGGPGGRNVVSMQRGYALLQEYIPHEVTWRVNKIGRCFAIFKRYNKPGTLTAQTGNVDGLKSADVIEQKLDTLLEFADAVANDIGSRWVALDILHRDGKWFLLETSLAWPWPSPGNCMEANFLGPTSRTWAGMWDLMLDEYEAGVWAQS